MGVGICEKTHHFTRDKTPVSCSQFVLVCGSGTTSGMCIQCATLEVLGTLVVYVVDMLFGLMVRYNIFIGTLKITFVYLI
jgi:hypothetical protein